jgi:quercetin 2,3-dioxygenase
VNTPDNSPNNYTARSVVDIWPAHPVTDGDGVRINRNAFSGRMHLLDPFLMLDEIASDEADDYIGGFPEHPHRGFETVTYMLEGKMQHRDHMGNTGELVSGSVQWMTAGRGVLHSEMPQQESGRLHGFQLWVNLPAKDKLCEPNYREYQPEAIPEVSIGKHSHAKVIAGNFQQWQDDAWQTAVSGPVQGIATAPAMYDIKLTNNDELNLHLDNKKKVIVYVYQGELDVVSGTRHQQVNAQHMALLTHGETLKLKPYEDTRFLLLAGVPLREPIANWGPFVMNTGGEIEQALEDYRSGRLVSM